MDIHCYACGQPGSTREHVPPRAFFPRGRRGNLWTVPSCRSHNTDNSLDIEYVRNVICVQRNTNAIAEAVFEAAKRSWNRSPALFTQTFRDVVEAVIDGEPAGLFPFDLDRVTTVLSAIARALSYRDFGPQYKGEWRVFCATLLSRVSAPEWDSFRNMVSGVRFSAKATPDPDIFTYGVHILDVAFIYRLVFYEGFVAFAWPVMPIIENG
jgi:hypothetical protein